MCDLDFKHIGWDLAGGCRTLGNYTLAEASPVIEYFMLGTNEDDNIPEGVTPYINCLQEGVRMTVKHNTLDDNIYPKNGSRWNFEAKGIFNAGETIDGYDDVGKNFENRDRKYLKLNTSFERAFTINYKRWPNASTTLVPWAAAGISTKQIIEPDKFYLGGFEYNMRYGQTPFIGLQPNQICTNNYSIAGITVRHEYRKYFNAVVHVNALAAYDELKDLGNPTVSSLGIGAGVLIRTPIGPICLIQATDTHLQKEYYYFNIGFNLPYIK